MTDFEKIRACGEIEVAIRHKRSTEEAAPRDIGTGRRMTNTSAIVYYRNFHPYTQFWSSNCLVGHPRLETAPRPRQARPCASCHVPAPALRVHTAEGQVYTHPRLMQVHLCRGLGEK